METEKIFIVCGASGIGEFIASSMLECEIVAHEEPQRVGDPGVVVMACDLGAAASASYWYQAERQRFLDELTWGAWCMEVIVKPAFKQAPELVEVFAHVAPERIKYPEPPPYRGYMSGRRRYK